MCAAFQAHSIGLTVICKWPSQVEVPATEDATYRITHVVLQPAMPGWHCSRIEIVIELRVARSGALLVCSFFARYFCAIRDFAGDEVGSRDPGSTSRRQPACKASTVLAEFAIGTMLKSKAGWEWATQPARLCFHTRGGVQYGVRRLDAVLDPSVQEPPGSSPTPEVALPGAALTTRT